MPKIYWYKNDRKSIEVTESVSEILDVVDQEAKALLAQESFADDVGQLFNYRDVMDADGAVIHSFPYVKETISDILGPGTICLVADDVKSGRVVDDVN